MAQESLRVEASIDDPQLVQSAYLLFRTTGETKYRKIEFRRSEGAYLVEIPAERVKAPGLEYAIEMVSTDAVRHPAFSSRANPHSVLVPEDGMDLIERANAKRVDGRRSVFSGRGEYVSFGDSIARVAGPEGQLVERVVDDHYYRIEGGYTYRPLGVISEFSIHVGVVRGRAPVPVRDLVPGQSENERFDVGLNYGKPSVRFRLGEHWHLDGSFLANVTEVGFSVGTGSTLHIGDVRGSKVSLGFEAIQTFGVRFFTQLDIQALSWMKLSPMIEVTNMPSADDFGVRLLGELGFDVGAGVALNARGGYQARDFASGGFSAGGGASYAF